MKILKVAFGDETEAFIESSFTDGVNIISSDDNNKGKTIVIQSMMYALGNQPTFPASFEFKKYYYYVEFKENEKTYKICRSNSGFVLKEGKSLQIFENVAELKRFWSKNISMLPSIIKNKNSRLVDPELYMQMFFIGQDKKDTSNIAHHDFYKKQDFIEMLFGFAGLGPERLSQEQTDEIKQKISKLADEKKLLLKQHKILKSQKAAVSYFSSESDRLLFKEKIDQLREEQEKITELRKQRNVALARKSNWEATINELKSLNRNISYGELRCMDCNSTNIMLSFGSSEKRSYAFDVSSIEMREEIINSISDKIDAYEEEINILSAKINTEQENLQSLMKDDKVSLESIVAYKRDIFSASDAENIIKKINDDTADLESKLLYNDKTSRENEEQRKYLLNSILLKMKEFYRRIDPEGTMKCDTLFTKRDEVYSGSESTIFHFIRLFAFQAILQHKYPIVIDSFRAEDLSTSKEDIILNISESIGNQVIFTTTLKQEEYGKYGVVEGVNHIDYTSHLPSKILKSEYVDEFSNLLSELSLNTKK